MTKHCWNCIYCVEDLIGAVCEYKDKPTNRYDCCKFWELSENEDFQDETEFKEMGVNK